MAFGLSAGEAAPIVVAATAAFARPVWAISRHLATLVHEAGHAAVAVATRRRLSGIRLHTDTSGLTITVGRSTGPGMVATAAAGYLAVPALGLALVAASRSDLSVGVLWVLLAMLLLMVVFVRNWFGVVPVLLAAAGVALLSSLAPVMVQNFALAVGGWFLLFAGLRTTLDLGGYRQRMRSRTSDADVLARLTRIPALVWNAVFVAAALGATMLAAYLVTEARLIG